MRTPKRASWYISGHIKGKSLYYFAGFKGANDILISKDQKDAHVFRSEKAAENAVNKIDKRAPEFVSRVISGSYK